MRFLTTIAAALYALTLSLTPAGALDSFASNVVISDIGATIPVEQIEYADGRKGTLKDFEGNVMVVTLWQADCPFCHKELPVLDRLSRDMDGQGIKVVALGLDQSMSQIQGFLNGKQLNSLTPIMDSEKINGSLFSIEHFGSFSIATPTSFIVDKSGNVVARVWGLVDWDGDPARDFLRNLAAS